MCCSVAESIIIIIKLVVVMELQRVGLEQDQAKREREFFVCLSSMSQRTISPGFVQLYSEWRFTIANGAAGMESIASSENEEHS